MDDWQFRELKKRSLERERQSALALNLRRAFPLATSSPFENALRAIDQADARLRD